VASLDVVWVDQHYDRENAGLGRSRSAELAERTVTVLVRELNDLLAPMVTELEAAR
jgi:hypothetical protein